MKNSHMSLLIGAIFTNFVNAAEIITTMDMDGLQRRAEQAAVELGPQKVLVVYDLDNTLLAMDQDLGSDQWFDWQSSILSVPSADRVATDIAGLLSVQGKLFALSGMHLTRTEIPAVVQRLRDLKIDQMVLSSRGPEFRESTLRELKRSGLTFSSGLPSVTTTYMPFDLNDPEKDCLTKNEVAQFKLSSPRPVSFGDGIMMTSGLHKGAMLRSFLCPQPGKYSVILFIDDKTKNTDAVAAAYTDNSPTMVIYRYAQEDQRVQAFHASDKQQAISAWSALRDILEWVFRQN